MSLGLRVWGNKRVHKPTGQCSSDLWWARHCGSSKGPVPPGPHAEWSPPHTGSADPLPCPALVRSPLAPKTVFQVMCSLLIRPRMAGQEIQHGGAPCQVPRSHRTESCPTGQAGLRGGMRVVRLTPGRGLWPPMPPGVRDDSSWVQSSPWDQPRPDTWPWPWVQPQRRAVSKTASLFPSLPPRTHLVFFQGSLANGEQRLGATHRWILAWRPIS